MESEITWTVEATRMAFPKLPVGIWKVQASSADVHRPQISQRLRASMLGPNGSRAQQNGQQVFYNRKRTSADACG
jgi:hypothetical protein